VTPTSATVGRGAASDDITPKEELMYKVLRAANITEIKTPAKVQVALDWTAGATSLDVAQLQAGTAYYFMVLVKDVSGNTAYYEPKAVTPKEDKPTADNTAPVPGAGLTFSEVSYTQMVVSWGAATDDRTPQKDLEYQLRCIPSGGTLEDAVGISKWTKNVLSKVLPNLTYATTYDCVVMVRDAARNEALYGPAAKSTLSEGSSGKSSPPAPSITVTTPNGGETWYRNFPGTVALVNDPGVQDTSDAPFQVLGGMYD
jgi:hypothetical protein